MHKTTLILIGALLLMAGSAAAGSPAAGPPVSFGKEVRPLGEVDSRLMPLLDNALLKAEAELEEAGKMAVPFRMAQAIPVDLYPENAGTWEVLDDGSRLWRLHLTSLGARHLNLGFSRFELPPGAELWIYNPAGDMVQGPYTAADRSALGRLYTPVVRGSEVIVELHVPAGAEGPIDLHLGAVNHGFRGFEKGLQGTCNIDVVCPEGNPWRDQIRSVARYTVDGLFLCTGQLVNNAVNQDVPYFLTAYHCGITDANADTVTVYWNYEAPTCGQQTGGSLNQSQTGSVLRARDSQSDFALVELDQIPNPNYDVYYAGVDARRAIAPQGSVGIHHPQGDVKSICFNNDPLGMIGVDVETGQIDSNGDSHWEVDNWEQGTTEPGSSGSCLFDPATGLCIGLLTGGRASCTNIAEDFYGKLNLAWDAGTTTSARLRDWLDPQSSGTRRIEGRDSGTPPPPPPPPPPVGPCVPSDTVLCLQDGRFQVEVERVGNQGPGPARVVPLGVTSDDSAVLWFFSPDNWEMLVKVLDGCSFNNRYWVFAATASDVEWTLTVTDTETSMIRQYRNPAGTAAPALTDTSAFATCP